MRRIELKTITLDGHEVTYKQILDQVLSVPKDRQRGTTPAEMRKVIPIMDKIDGATISVLLEEAEWEEITARIEAFPFNINSREMLQFVDDMLEAEKADVAEMPRDAAG